MDNRVHLCPEIIPLSKVKSHETKPLPLVNHQCRKIGKGLHQPCRICHFSSYSDKTLGARGEKERRDCRVPPVKWLICMTIFLNNMFSLSKVCPRSLQQANEYCILPSSCWRQLSLRLAISEERSFPPLSRVESLFPYFFFFSCFTCLPCFLPFTPTEVLFPLYIKIWICPE